MSAPSLRVTLELPGEAEQQSGVLLATGSPNGYDIGS
jgi:hypothetical protein